MIAWIEINYFLNNQYVSNNNYDPLYNDFNGEAVKTVDLEPDFYTNKEMDLTGVNINEVCDQVFGEYEYNRDDDPDFPDGAIKTSFNLQNNIQNGKAIRKITKVYHFSDGMTIESESIMTQSII